MAGTDQTLPDNPLLGPLQQAGITITYLAPRRLPDGIESPGLEITVAEQGPSGSPASGTFAARYVLGRAIATVDTSPGAAGAGPGDSLLPGPGLDASGGSLAGGGSVAGGSSLPASGVAGSVAQAPPGASTDLAGLTPEQASPPSRPPAGRGQPGYGTRVLAAASTPGHLEMVDIYLVMVVAGSLIAAASLIFRRVGTGPVV